MNNSNNSNNPFTNFTNQNYSELSNWLNSLNPYEFAVVGVVAAFLIAPFLTTNQQNSIGNFLEEVGQVLLTIGAQNTTVNQASQNNNSNNNNNNNSNCNNNTNNNNDEIAKLKQEIENLKKIINNKQ